MPKPSTPISVEPYFTVPEAAKVFGVRTWALRRAIKSGVVPSYTPFNGRKLVRLSEIAAAITASKIGGTDV